jgi:hypothetical protein
MSSSTLGSDRAGSSLHLTLRADAHCCTRTPLIKLVSHVVVGTLVMRIDGPRLVDNQIYRYQPPRITRGRDAAALNCNV